MTQIKLRRDTYANFTASNPVLGSGEPAYETDTKKLKIGDGSTAYTQLDYFSSGGGSGSVDITATLPLKIDENGVISLNVDGQTIQIVDGKLHANIDELGNEVNDLSGRVTANEADITTIQSDITDINGTLDNTVTLDTKQTLTAEKKVPSLAVDGGGVCFVSDRATGGFIGYEYWDNKGPAIDFRPYNYPAQTNNIAGDVILRSGLSGGSIYRFNTSNLYKQQGNGTIDSVYFNSSNLTAGNNVTISGDYNNGYKISATSSTPDNMVTTDTEQTISGIKTFTNAININSTDGNSSIRLLYQPIGDSLTNAELLNLANTSLKKIYFGIDGFTTILSGEIKDSSNNNFLTDSSTNKALIASWGLPDTSDSSSRPTVGASGTEYTMPFNGYVTLQGETNATNGYGVIDVFNGSSWDILSTLGYMSSESGLYNISSFVPVKKDGKYRVRYGNLGTVIIIQYPLLGGDIT